MVVLFRYPLFVCFSIFGVVKSRAVITFTERVRRFAFVLPAIFIKLVVSFSYHIFFLFRPRSEGRSTVFYSVRAMCHFLVIARVLALSFVVFERISG